MNAQIREELCCRYTKAREEFGAVPKKLVPLLEYFDKQPLENVVNKLVSLLSKGMHWDDPVQAAGFEWYYDGTSMPSALGYGYASIATPDLSTFVTGKTSQARDDFHGNVSFGAQQFCDSGEFDVAAVCYPLYEYLEVNALRDDDVDRLINLFTARLLYAMHLAMSVLARSETLESLPTKSPFFFFANNHDWSPILIYDFSDRGEAAEEFGDSEDLHVHGLQKFIDGLEKKKVKKLLKEDYVRRIRNGPVELLEKALLDLPFLKSDGHSLKIAGTDLVNFQYQKISDEEVYPALSFEALLNFFEATAKPKQKNIDYSLTYLFLNNPKRAVETLSERTKSDESMKEAIEWSIKNLLRWVEGPNIETRWHNPTWALKKSEAAIAAMKELISV